MSDRTGLILTGYALNTVYKHMFGRLLATAAGVGAVIAVEQVLRKSQMLYDLVMSGTLAPQHVLLIWICLLPLIFYHAGPEIISIAAAWRYHQWIENHEIVALRSAGQSCRRIALPGILAGLVGCLFCALNSILLMPLGWSTIEDIRASAMANVSTALLQPGRAEQLSSGTSLMFSRRDDDGTLEEVLISDGRADISARRARLVRLAGSDILQLTNGTYLPHDTDGFKPVLFSSLSLPLHTIGNEPARPQGFYEQPITRLLNPPAHLRQRPAERAAWLTEGNRRIINPLLCIANTLLVLGLMIPNRRNRLRQRVLFGVAIASGLATNTLPDLLISTAIEHPGLLPSLYLLPIVPFAVGVLLLLRSDRAGTGVGLPRSPRPPLVLAESSGPA